MQAAQVLLIRESQGVGMGILQDGTPFLTANGLARLCGVDPAELLGLRSDWEAGDHSSRFARLLREHELDGADLRTPLDLGGAQIDAYSARACLAFLDYFAHQAPMPTEAARRHLRQLGLTSFQQFVYGALGYSIQAGAPGLFGQFHERLLQHKEPKGYFSVFREISDLVLSTIRAGLNVGERVMPDISVGRFWSNHWDHQDLDLRIGPRIQYEHRFPDSFPQAKSNPHLAWAYPEAALGEFRRWLREEYLSERFPDYLASLVARGALSEGTANLILAALGHLPLVSSK